MMGDEVVPQFELIKINRGRFFGVPVDKTKDSWLFSMNALMSALEYYPRFQLVSRNLWIYVSCLTDSPYGGALWLGYHVCGHELVEHEDILSFLVPEAVGVRLEKSAEDSMLWDTSLYWPKIRDFLKERSYPPSNWFRIPLQQNQGSHLQYWEIPLYSSGMNWDQVSQNP
jgi:hypothetical protein